MAVIYISVGSNIDRKKNLRAALAALRARFDHVRTSPVYESVAVGFDGKNFYNLVVEAHTDLTPDQVVQTLRATEDAQLRDRTQPKFSPRTLDLDLLLYDDLVVQQPEFQLPRDEIVKYAFVLAPLADLVPQVLHPTLKQTFAELWQQFERGDQELWQVELAL